jgi:Xaa-Pro aminopeptidase
MKMNVDMDTGRKTDAIKDRGPAHVQGYGHGLENGHGHKLGYGHRWASLTQNLTSLSLQS